MLKKRIIKLFTLFTATLFLSGCTLRNVFIKTPDQLTIADVTLFINKLIDILAAFGGVVAVFFMIAGYQMLMGAASEDMANRAKSTLTYSAIGMFVVVIAYAIVRLVFSSLADPNKINNIFS